MLKAETILSGKLQQLGHRPRQLRASQRRESTRLECMYCGQWAEMEIDQMGGDPGLRITGPAISEICQE